MSVYVHENSLICRVYLNMYTFLYIGDNYQKSKRILAKGPICIDKVVPPTFFFFLREAATPKSTISEFEEC